MRGGETAPLCPPFYGSPGPPLEEPPDKES